MEEAAHTKDRITYLRELTRSNSPLVLLRPSFINGPGWGPNELGKASAAPYRLEAAKWPPSSSLLRCCCCRSLQVAPFYWDGRETGKGSSSICSIGLSASDSIRDGMNGGAQQQPALDTFRDLFGWWTGIFRPELCVFVDSEPWTPCGGKSENPCPTGMQATVLWVVIIS